MMREARSSFSFEIYRVSSSHGPQGRRAPLPLYRCRRAAFCRISAAPSRLSEPSLVAAVRPTRRPLAADGEHDRRRSSVLRSRAPRRREGVAPGPQLPSCEFGRTVSDLARAGSTVLLRPCPEGGYGTGRRPRRSTDGCDHDVDQALHLHHDAAPRRAAPSSPLVTASRMARCSLESGFNLSFSRSISKSRVVARKTLRMRVITSLPQWSMNIPWMSSSDRQWASVRRACATRPACRPRAPRRWRRRRAAACAGSCRTAHHRPGCRGSQPGHRGALSLGHEPAPHIGRDAESLIAPATLPHEVLLVGAVPRRAPVAHLLRRAAVTGIARGDRGFRMDASRGPVRAGRIVHAAGAFASTVGRTLGVDVPVHDAPLQTVVTEPAAPTIGHLVTHAARHLTLKQAGNGAFIIGGGWTAGLAGSTSCAPGRR